MRIAVTVNLGNYENIRVESSDLDTATECLTEVDETLAMIHEPRVDDFRKRITEVV